MGKPKRWREKRRKGKKEFLQEIQQLASNFRVLEDLQSSQLKTGRVVES
jgi:hypothetical protein